MSEKEQKDWRELEPTYPVKIFLTVLYSLILVTGILGNSVTIRVTQVLRRNGYLQKNVTDHMVSLACSDLLVLLIGMPVELYSAIWFPFTTEQGDAPCKIYNFLFEACSYATILNVATLSFERYVAICHPFRYKALGGKRTSVLITFAWLVSVLVALPLLIATGAQGHIPLRADAPAQDLTFCTNLREHWVMYRVSIFVAFIVYMVVLIGVAVMCWAMVLVLRRPLGGADGGGGINGAQGAAKHEDSKAKTARKQTIIFLALQPTVGDGPADDREGESHRGVLDGVLASQPDSSSYGGCRAQVRLDYYLLPELRHSPPCGRLLLLPQLRAQPVPLQPLLQTVQGGFCPGAAVSPHHRTRQQAHRAQLPPRLRALPPSPAEVVSSQQGQPPNPRRRENSSHPYNHSESK
ncbi:G-protein coupled receptor 39 isoform X2 [Perca fluviatilis]|uniref:G-protein coupled receptor 39 isoform X2 n=1 Tax=Perca fluviatilis TaxID=8168 RepID=UPI0019637D83|nr:G-protein coupled receptor 39 isoform X2 [Perca fluviatilis]